jgi:hypothetical protein
MHPERARKLSHGLGRLWSWGLVYPEYPLANSHQLLGYDLIGRHHSLFYKIMGHPRSIIF